MTIEQLDLRIACCLCSTAIPTASDIYALDQEWQRRFPTMNGTLACDTCAVGSTTWRCRDQAGAFPAGHHPSARKLVCRDSWDHIDGFGTHAAMVCTYLDSALRQGGANYLRSLLGRRGVDADLARAIEDAFTRRDTESTATALQTP